MTQNAYIAFYVEIFYFSMLGKTQTLLSCAAPDLDKGYTLFVLPRDKMLNNNE